MAEHSRWSRRTSSSSLTTSSLAWDADEDEVDDGGSSALVDSALGDIQMDMAFIDASSFICFYRQFPWSPSRLTVDRISQMDSIDWTFAVKIVAACSRVGRKWTPSNLRPMSGFAVQQRLFWQAPCCTSYSQGLGRYHID